MDVRFLAITCFSAIRASLSPNSVYSIDFYYVEGELKATNALRRKPECTLTESRLDL